jgi:hypothetical protein
MNRSLLVSLTAMVFAGCASYAPPQGNPCAKAVPLSSSNRPIICVDDRNLAKLTTSPYETWAKRKAVVRWYTVTGEGGLAIAFNDQTCIKGEDLNCQAGSNCEAKIADKAPTGTKCQYVITLTRKEGNVREDPIIIVDTGMVEEPFDH